MAGISVKEDKYILGQSGKKSLKELAEEIRLDLSLKPNPNLQAGTVYGVVNDSQGTPIPGALVKIMDSDHNPLAHSITGSDGNYTFSPFPAGTNYHNYAIAQGYLLAEGIPFTLLAGQKIQKDFTLSIDTDATKGIIAGDINSSKDNKPIKGAAVNLYSLDNLGNKTLIGVTFTNEFGQFTFRELDKGNYIVQISALGYVPESNSITINQDGQIAHVVLKLEIDPMSARGTISGIVTDDNNMPINSADVVLYKVGDDDNLTPISFTKTNDEGLYLFVNVQQGDYKVKSNKTIIVTI